MNVSFRPHQGIIFFSIADSLVYLLDTWYDVSVPIRGLFFLALLDLVEESRYNSYEVSVPIRGLFFLATMLLFVSLLQILVRFRPHQGIIFFSALDDSDEEEEEDTEFPSPSGDYFF